MATRPYYVSQYTPQHMTEEEQIQEAIRLSLGDSGTCEHDPDVYLPCDLNSSGNYSAVRSLFERPTIIQELAYRIPTQEDLPDPDVIQSAINSAKTSSNGPMVSDLESVSQMLFSDFGVDLAEEIDCDEDEAQGEEVVEVEEMEDYANDVNISRKKGYCLQFSGRNVHYRKAYTRDIDISKIVSGPPESMLYGNPLSQYYQPLNKTLHNAEHKRKMTREDKKFWQLKLLRTPSLNSPSRFSPPDSISEIRTSKNSFLVETPRRFFVTPSPVSMDCKDADEVYIRAVSLQGTKPTVETRLGTKRDGSSDTETQAGPKRLCVSTTKTDLSCVKRKFSAWTKGLQAAQKLYARDLAEFTDTEHIEVNKETLQPSPKKMRLIETKVESTAVECNVRMGKKSQSIDLHQDANDVVVECKNLQSRFSKSNLNILQAVLENKQMQPRKRIESAEKNHDCSSSAIESSINNNSGNISSNSPSSHCAEAIINGYETSLKETGGSTIATKITFNEKQLCEDLSKCAILTPAVQEKSPNKDCDGMEYCRAKLSASRLSLSASRAALETLTKKKLSVGTQMAGANRKGRPERLRRPPCKSNEWNKQLQSVKFRTRPQVLSVGSSATTMYSPYHLKLFHEMNYLKERDYSSVPSMVDEFQESEPAVLRELLKAPAVVRTDLLTGSTHCSSSEKTVGKSSIHKKPIEGTVMDDIEAGPSGYNPCELNDDSDPPDDALAVFNNNDFLKLNFDIGLKWWVVNVSKSLIFPNHLPDRVPCSLLTKNYIMENIVECTTVWRFFANNRDQITNTIKKAEKFLDTKNLQLEPLTQFLLVKDGDDLKTSQFMKDMLKYTNEQYGLPERMEYESHEETLMIQRGSEAPSSITELYTRASIDRNYESVLPSLGSSTPSNCSEEIHHLKINYQFSGGERGALSTMHTTIFSQGHLKRPPVDKKSPRCTMDTNQKGVLTTSKMNFGLEKLPITTKRPGTLDSALESQGSDDDHVDSTVSDTANGGSSENASNSDHKKSSPLLIKLQSEERVSRLSTEFRQNALCSNEGEISDTTKDEPNKENILDVDTSGDELHNDCGYTSDNNMECKSIPKTKSYSLSTKNSSSGGESSSDEESTTSHLSDEAARRSSLGYHSQSSDSSFDEDNGGEFVSGWSSHVGKSSLYQNITEAEVFSGPYKLLKYFEISCFGRPVIMHSITPDVFFTVKDHEKRYTISRANPFVNKTTEPDALSMTEMVQMAAKLGCFHGVGLAFQRLDGHSFMAKFRNTMRTGLSPEADLVKAATVGLTNFIEKHYNDVSKRQFLDYLGRQFGKGIPTRLNYLLTPHTDEDMKFWTLIVGDVTPRNIVIYNTKQICDPKVLRWNKSRIGNCFLDLVSLLVTLPDQRCKEVQVLSTFLSYLTALDITLRIFSSGYYLNYYTIIMSIRKAAMLLVYQFMAEEDTYRGPTEQDNLYGMVWNAALFATDPGQVNWDCPWKEKASCT